MANGKQEEKKSTFRPFAENGGARSSHQHQKVDLKLAFEYFTHGLTQHEITAEKVSREQEAKSDGVR